METVQQKRLVELQEKGWKKLTGEERKEFQDLKEASVTKVVKAPVITTLVTKTDEEVTDVKQEDTKKNDVYTFTTNVLHGSKLYKEGDTIESPMEEWITSGYVTNK